MSNSCENLELIYIYKHLTHQPINDIWNTADRHVITKKSSAIAEPCFFPPQISYVLFKALLNSLGPSPISSAEPHESMLYLQVLAEFEAPTYQLIVYWVIPGLVNC